MSAYYAYYNECDEKKAAWLRELIARHLIAPGDVDERSIADVMPTDLTDYTQCHFFAGIGAWSYALRLAGWDDTRPVWTGSCPCQPFSVAGRGDGAADPRHLWPEWARLIRECRPPGIFGEQVASPLGLQWFDLVHADLEGAGYAVGGADLCAAGVGAPHRRQRLYFVGDASRGGLGKSGRSSGASRFLAQPDAARGGADTDGTRGAARLPEPGEWEEGDAGVPFHGGGEEPGARRRSEGGGSGVARDASREGLEGHAGHGDARDRFRWLDAASTRSVAAAGATRGFWGGADWWIGTDGQARPTQPGLFPLAHGAPARVVRLRGYGDAIVAPLAAAFIAAASEVMA